ncbi:MAG: hypothetical protein MUC42_01530, partial [Bryobacter sp.]|nr:hypothetical protein [Bryobacter sp.]
MSTEEYYALKVRPIYRTYPVYAPGREPAGYRESLKQKEPEILFDAAKLQTKADWIRAGKLVFESEPLLFPAPEKEVFFPSPLPPNQDGSLPEFLPGARYIIRKKGVLEVGINSCAGCHTRVMPDGTLLAGAQGVVDFPSDAEQVRRARELSEEAVRRRQQSVWVLYGAPWILSKEKFLESFNQEMFIRLAGADHPGVLARQGTSATHPPHIPS